MFCLRTWIPVLFFLSNTSPLYLILFVTATWFLHRPCSYCSLLLSILVVSLYDWRKSWLEPRNNLWYSREDLFSDLVNSTAAEVLGAAVGDVEGRLLGENGRAVISGAQWLRELIGRREWRIPCLEIAVRL